MNTCTLPSSSLPTSSPILRARSVAKASGPTHRTARLFANRKERINLLEFSGTHAGDFRISEFLSHPSGIEALLNTRALQNLEPLGSNTYRCTLHRVQFLKFQVSPVLDLRVTPTSTDCTVEMLSCKFEGSKQVEQQNRLFSASMTNYITWEGSGSEPFLDIDVNLQIALEVYTKPFSLLPVSAVEKPGNLIMQGLVNKLVPMLAQQLLENYRAWVEEEQSELCLIDTTSLLS